MHRRRRLGVLVSLLAVAAGAAIVLRRGSREGAAGTILDEGPIDEPVRVFVVDVAFATEHPLVVEAIEQVGGDVRIFDFPGATYPNGRRFVWARDFGPLQLPNGDGPWIAWDAVNGGATTPALENDAVPALARRLGAPHRRLDLVVQGGNWLLLPDDRAIATTKLLDENPDMDADEIRDLLEQHGITGLILIEPLPGDLTQHADMVLNVDPRTGDCLVGQVWPTALSQIPAGEEWADYRELSELMAASLDRTAQLLGAALGPNRVHRLPQPLPHLEQLPSGPRRPTFPSFVNGIFVTAGDGQVSYLYGVAGDPEGVHYYSFDASLLPRYQEAVASLGHELDFQAVGVPSGDLVLGGGSLHCATVEARLVPAGSPRRSLATRPTQ